MQRIYHGIPGPLTAAMVLAAMLLWPVAAGAAEVRGRDVGTNGQLEFEWDEPSGYRMRQNGNRILVVFDQQVGEGAAQAFRRVGSYLEEGRIIGDGTTVLMVLEPSVSLVDRQVGNAVVFELHPDPSGAEPGAEASAATAPTPPPEAPPPMPDLDLSAKPDPAPEPPTPPVERPTIRVRGGEHADYSRIVFDWSSSVGYDVEQDGGRIRIAFDLPANADFTRAAPANLSRIDALRQTDEAQGMVVTVAVPSDSRLRHFRSGPKVVLDILEGDGTPAPTLAERPQPAPRPPPRPEPPVETADPVVIATRDPATRTPHASSRETSAEQAGETTSAPVVEAAPVSTPEPSPEGELADASESAPAREADQPMSLLPQRPIRRTPVTVEVLPARPAAPVASFDPGAPSALAVFERGPSLWVVFASGSSLDANVLAAQGRPALGAVDVVRAEGGIALRFQPSQRGEIVVSQRGTTWNVAVEPAAIRSAVNLEIVPQPDYPLGPRLLAEGGTGQGLVRLTDPLVGDVLIVAPVREPAAGLAEPASFAQVRLLESVQGLVARPMSDSLAMRVARDGIEITDVDGLLLSPSADTAREVMAIAPPIDTSDRLLEIDVWRGIEGDGFIAQRQALQRTLATADEVDRDRARLDFARFNFAHGFAEEAIGLLELVEESQPSIGDREHFLVLRGAARVLADDLAEAAGDLGHPGLAESRDAALWRAVSAAKSADWPRAANEFEMAGRLIETYPRPFADMLTRLAARTAIEVNDPQAAEAQLTRLSALTNGESDRWASTNYLRAVMAQRAGDLTAATAAFEAAAMSDDRYHRTLSELALIEIDLAEGGFDWEEAVAGFESLRFAWRGDEIESQLIDRIEGLYWQAGRYRKALETLQQAARSFPETPVGEAYGARLQARFVELFGSGRIDSMPPLAAISLYHDYDTLMPNDEDGDRVLRGLAERLVEIDLLDQAGDILAELIDTRLEGPERVRTGTRLAGIRLLSGQPEAAIAALDASEMDVNALPSLAPERRLLRAHALAELGDPTGALDLLAGVSTPIASAARADIAWHIRDWRTAAAALTQLVKPPPADGGMIADSEADLVLNLGIALALANDADGLARLARDYGAAMSRSPSANTFAILTRSPGGTPQIADLAAIRQQVSEVDLFQQFLSGYRTAGEPQG